MAKKTLPHVSEAELTLIVSYREQVKRLSVELTTLKTFLGSREADVIERLKKGEPVVGSLAAEVVQESGRVVPRWKDVWAKVVTSLGKDVAAEEAKVKAQYPAPIHDSLTIVRK